MNIQLKTSFDVQMFLCWRFEDINKDKCSINVTGGTLQNMLDKRSTETFQKNTPWMMYEWCFCVNIMNITGRAFVHNFKRTLPEH